MRFTIAISLPVYSKVTLRLESPLILVPRSEFLVLVRSGSRERMKFLQPGDASLISEAVDNDNFENESRSEYAVVSVQRGHALLITPTCDLGDDNALWIVWPIHPFEGSI